MTVKAIRGPFERNPDGKWVRSLTGASEEEVAATLREARGDSEFWHEIAREHAGGGRQFYAHIRAPYELYAITRLIQPAHIVEIGVSSGVSSAAFLRGLQRNGQGMLHSIDLPTFQKGKTFEEGKDSPVALPEGRATGWAVPPPVRKGWDLRLGSSQDLLPRLVKELPSIELFLHDSLHTFDNATFEFTTVLPKVPPGGILLADNNEWLDKALETFAKKIGAKEVYRRGIDLGGLRVPP